MTKLVEVKDIPKRMGLGGNNAVYPWAEWMEQLSNGKALKLARKDFPKESATHRNWDDTKLRCYSLRSSAKQKGWLMAIRGDHIYLWRA